jgi:3-oxocholest-4-en-26-oate---CoA ligase
MEFNLADLFECVADTVPTREAIICAARRLSYRELEERSNRLGNALAERGVRPGDHVALFLYNCTEFLEAMLACYKMRAVPVNVNYRYVGDELAYVLDDADAEVLIFHQELAGVVSSIEPPRSVALRVVVPGDTGGGDVSPMTDEYGDLLSSASPERRFPRRSGDDRYILYTGGTTGLPKGVVWRQEDIIFATLGGGNAGGAPLERPGDIARAVLGNRAQRVTPFLPPGHQGPSVFTALALGPLMHASGQWSALSTLLGGGKVVLNPARRMDMDRVLELVDAEAVTMLTLVGDASGRPLLDTLRAKRGRYDTSSLLLLGSGGSILSAEVKEGLLRELPSVLAISEAIGSSEAPVQGVAVARPTGEVQSTLRFAPREQTMVVDDQLHPIEPGSGQVGRLATTGRVPLGYHKDPDRSAVTFVEIEGLRWAMPGDMATVDSDGTIRLLGRGSMCINTGGEKVYPEEVEAIIKSHPSVADAVVIGIPDVRFGEKVTAIVAPSSLEDPPAIESLQEHCRGHLAGYKLPRALYLVEEVVRSPSGKADYRWAYRVAGQPEAGTADDSV